MAAVQAGEMGGPEDLNNPASDSPKNEKPNHFCPRRMNPRTFFVEILNVFFYCGVPDQLFSFSLRLTGVMTDAKLINEVNAMMDERVFTQQLLDSE